MTLDGDARKVAERRIVRRHDSASGRSGGRGDHEVMCPAGSTLSADRDEKLRMGFSYVEVVVNNRDRRDDILNKLLSLTPSRAARELDSYFQFCDGNRCDRNVVIVRDCHLGSTRGALSVDQVRGVE